MAVAQSRIRDGLIRTAVVLASVAAGAGCTNGTGDDLPEPVGVEQSTTIVTTSTLFAPGSTVAAPPTTLQALAGVAYIGPGPQEGAMVAVIGVPYDDFLPVRSGPGADSTVVGALEPTAVNIVLTGRAQLLPDSIWYEITVDGTLGWVDASNIGVLGGLDDLTAQVIALLGSHASADTMLELGALVAQVFIGEEPRGWVGIVEAPTQGDPTVVTADVIGGADDAVIGYRIRVFGTQSSDDGSFGIHSVERTVICWRGVTTDGLCV